MRDPQRIPKILDQLKPIWAGNPDLRLGQLLLNAIRDPALYYVEDEKLVEVLRKFYYPSGGKNT